MSTAAIVILSLTGSSTVAAFEPAAEVEDARTSEAWQPARSARPYLWAGAWEARIQAGNLPGLPQTGGAGTGVALGAGYALTDNVVVGMDISGVYNSGLPDSGGGLRGLGGLGTASTFTFAFDPYARFVFQLHGPLGVFVEPSLGLGLVKFTDVTAILRLRATAGAHIKVTDRLALTMGPTLQNLRIAEDPDIHGGVQVGFLVGLSYYVGD